MSTWITQGDIESPRKGVVETLFGVVWQNCVTSLPIFGRKLYFASASLLRQPAITFGGPEVVDA